ncbi:hypothetical protein [Sphingosinicella sp. YJ22]|uniref:hypothetical protein n=1 Tax=Sphingosinicella sp. YJ22 TaxID=1104780 RepID=UPI001409C860|nr:hypothetical protein [Sphingosinicella sp. YJ22]
MAIGPIEFSPIWGPSPAPTATRLEPEVGSGSSYPAGTLFNSIRQQQAVPAGWNVVDDAAAEHAPAADSAEPALTAAAIMKDALAAMLAQANIGRNDALSLLLR